MQKNQAQISSGSSINTPGSGKEEAAQVGGICAGAVQPRGAVQAGGTRANEVGVAKGTSPVQDLGLLEPSWFRLGKMAVAGAASREQLVGWCTQQLRKTFGLDVSEEIMQ